MWDGIVTGKIFGVKGCDARSLRHDMTLQFSSLIVRITISSICSLVIKSESKSIIVPVPWGGRSPIMELKEAGHIEALTRASM